MEFGVTTQGYKRKSTQQIRESIENGLREQPSFGETWDYSDDSPFTQFYMVLSAEIGELHQIQENNFNNVRVATAEGNPLKTLGPNVGISAIQPRPATGQATFTGLSGTIIPIGFQIRTDNAEEPIIYRVTEQGVIGSGGTIILNIQAATAGATSNVVANRLTVIINPIPGLSSVTNAVAISNGINAETDLEFRQRYFARVTSIGGAAASAIAGGLRNVTGVTNAFVLDNKTATTDANGLPPHSFRAIVQGGTNQAIAEAILGVQPAGIDSDGTISENVTDSQGQTQTIRFSRPTEITLYVRLTLTKGPNFPSDGDTLITNALVEYIDGFALGADVINHIISSQVSQLNLDLTSIGVELSTDGMTYVSGNITIGNQELAVLTAARVVIQ